MRDEPKVSVFCDNCGYEERFDLCAVARRGYDERYLDQDLKKAGWSIEHGELCEGCASADTDKEEA